MHWQPNPHFLPLVLSALVSSALAAYAIRHRRAQGATGLAAVGICAAVWSLAFALYGASMEAGVRWWLIVAIHLGAGAVPVAWLVVALEHTGHERWLRSWRFRLAVAAAAGPLLLALTNGLHGWFFASFGVAERGGRVVSAIRYGPGFWAHVGVSWLILSAAFLLLAWRALRMPRGQRERDVALLLAVAIPWVGNVVHFLRPGFFTANPMPFLFTVSGMILGWAILRLRLIRVVPVARAALVDGMRDGVVVLDAEGIVVDLNPAARRILRVAEGRGVGEPGRAVLAPVQGGGAADGAPRRVALDGRVYQVTTSHVGERAGELVVLGDVTELAQKSSELEAIFQALPDLYFRLDAEGRILDHRAGEGEKLYVPPERFGGRRMVEVLPPEVAGPVRERLEEVRRTGRLATLEYSLDVGVRARDFEARFLPFGEDQVITVVRDVTDRKTAERALQRSEEHFRALIENGSDLISIVDTEGRFLYNSPSVKRILGRDPATLMGRSALRLMHRDDVPAAREALEAIAAAPGTSRAVEFRYRAADGTWRVLDGVGRTLRPDSTAEGIVVNSRDITRRRVASEALSASEESYRGLFDSLTELVYVQDLAGRFLNVNAAVVRAYGYSREELLGQTPALLADPERVDMEDTLARFARALAGEPQRFEWWGRRKDGSTFPKELVLTRSTYFGRDAVIAVARDITERKEAEEALQRAVKEAERANRAKSEFLSRMSHELRTPMNSILGFGQVLARHPLTPEQHRGVDHILRAGRHLLNLINEVLDIARIESGGQPLALEAVRAAVVVQDALALIRPVAAQHGCALHGEVSSAGSVQLRADRQRLTQVLLNLLSNAVKYNRPGGEVRVACDADDPAAPEPRVRISVHDTGMGIAPEKMDQLFVPFARLGAEETGVEGTGLGLALSRPLVEAMGGSIRVHSVVGEGSTFTVELPLVYAPGAQAAPAGPAAAANAEPEPAPGTTILYIEDNVANLSLIEAILADRPEVTLLSALQGRLGVELAAEHLPDLVLLDLHLPDVSGEEVLRRLRADARTRDIPVIVISADATAETTRRLLESGARAYVTKPLDVDRFIDSVDTVLGAAR